VENKMAGRTQKSTKSDKVVYNSPLDKLCASVKSSKKTSKSRSALLTNASSTSKSESIGVTSDISQGQKRDTTDTVDIPFATKLIPLENGIDDRYGNIPVLSLPSPPLPRQPPPMLPPPPAVASASVAKAPTPPEPQSMQGMLKESFKFLSEELGNTFSDTLGRLNNSMLRGLDGLRDKMSSVSNYGPP